MIALVMASCRAINSFPDRVSWQAPAMTAFWRKNSTVGSIQCGKLGITRCVRSVTIWAGSNGISVESAMRASLLANGLRQSSGWLAQTANPVPTACFAAKSHRAAVCRLIRLCDQIRQKQAPGRQTIGKLESGLLRLLLELPSPRVFQWRNCKSYG